VQLNQLAWKRVETILADPRRFGAELHQVQSGSRLVDLGVSAKCGLEAGKILAEICMADLGILQFLSHSGPTVMVQVRTDHPVSACFGAQYAGWQIKQDDFFAMGSGPMRSLARKEPILQELQITDSSEMAIGVLETGRMPSDAVCVSIAKDCGVLPEKLVLLCAPTASIAGQVQIVARSVETCMHKLHALKYEVGHVRSGIGVAPLPPIAANDMQGIGRTNDSILYGASVTLWVEDTIENLESVGEQLPSSASKDYGRPFEETLRNYDFDFYQVDPLLFSPAQVTLISLVDGKSTTVGQLNLEVLNQSFGGE